VRPLDGEVELLVPSASLAYVAEAQETLRLANEIESFTLDLDAAQSVSLLADPEQGLDVRIELFDPDGETLATTDEQGPGGSEWINWLPIGKAGKYRVDVQLVAGGGDFAFQWLVNAGTELENISGLNNDTPQLAEDVSAGWLPWIDQPTGLSHETLTIRGDRAAEETILSLPILTTHRWFGSTIHSDQAADSGISRPVGAETLGIVGLIVCTLVTPSQGHTPTQWKGLRLFLELI